MVEKQTRVAVIDGCRTPFLRSGTEFRDLMGWQIGKFAVKGLLARTNFSYDEIDQVIMGCVVSDIATTNIAREIGLGAGLPPSIPAYTCTVACISANQAITNGACAIIAGSCDVVVAGGVETFSDSDIKITKKYRQFLLDLTMFKRPKTFMGKLRLLKGMNPIDFISIERPSISEYSTGLIMGANAERLAQRLDITRQRQDEYAVMSHQRAVKAWDNNALNDEIIPVALEGKNTPVVMDNGPRKDAAISKLSKLNPAFDKNHGSVTAANSSFLTDGAAAVLLMKEDKAKKLGLEPLGFLKNFAYTAQDPVEELLLGPAFSISKLLSKAKLELTDIGVLEIHEAFAAQMLANIDCLESDKFAKNRLGLDSAVGKIDMDKLNRHGGSLSLGHPFGATGARLLTTCLRRMKKENQRYGIVSGCAAGAVGNAMLLENPLVD